MFRALFATAATVTYRGAYQTFLSAVNIMNLDLEIVLSTGYLWSGIDFNYQVLAGTIWPFVVLGLLAMTYTIALRRNSANGDRRLEHIRN